MDHGDLPERHADEAGGAAPGVGLYVDAEPSVNGRRLEIQTPEPGWKMEIYGSRAEAAGEWPSDDWTKLGGGTVESRKQSFKLDTGDRRYRYYLVWITELPPDSDQVAITQLTLSAPKDRRQKRGRRAPRGGARGRSRAAGRTPRATARRRPPTASGTPTSASSPAAC